MIVEREPAPKKKNPNPPKALAEGDGVAPPKNLRERWVKKAQEELYAGTIMTSGDHKHNQLLGKGHYAYRRLPLCKKHIGFWKQKQPAPYRTQHARRKELLFRIKLSRLRSTAQQGGEVPKAPT